MDAEPNILDYHDGFAEHRHVTSALLYERRSGREVVVTIAIPTFRRLALLKQALASAAAQHTDVQFEILIVDNDHESDGLETIEHLRTLDTPDLRYYRNEENVGMFGNWNRCLTLAAGEWITILNDDDLLHPTFLGECLRSIRANSAIQLIGTGADQLDERQSSTSVSNLRQFMRKLNLANWKPDVVRQLRSVDYFLNSPHHGSLGILMLAAQAREIGGYSPLLFPSADLAFLVRYQRRYSAYYRAKRLVTYRISVNESLKPTVVEGWVAQGLALRVALMPQIPLPRKLLELYSRLMAAEVVLLCKDYFSINFPIDNLRARYDLPTGPIYVPFRLLRIVIRTLSMIRRL